VRRTDLGLSILFLDHVPHRGRGDHGAFGRGVAGVQLPHVSIGVAVDPRRFRRGIDGSGGRDREVRVNAPMPGRVVRVLVKPGDEVAARQGWSSSKR
jgi:hypothetical protein